MLSGVRAVLLVEQLAEDAECNGGFQCGTGLGDDVHIEVTSAELFNRVAQRIGRETVADKENLRIAAAENGTQQFNGTAGTEIGTANADDDESLGTCADGIRRSQNQPVKSAPRPLPEVSTS